MNLSYVIVPLLIHVYDMHTESADSDKFICPVSRKTITSQPLVLIKPTGTLLIESVAVELVYPTMTCPITGKRFTQEDIVKIASAGSGFAATGSVIAKKHKASIN